MSFASRVKAFLAYLFLAVGGLVILLFNRKDRFAAFHARQSVFLTIVAIVGPVVWALCAYPISFVPFIGPILASASFALVIALFMALVIAWITGMIFALRAQPRFIPFFGEYTRRFRAFR